MKTKKALSLLLALCFLLGLVPALAPNAGAAGEREAKRGASSCWSGSMGGLPVTRIFSP